MSKLNTRGGRASALVLAGLLTLAAIPTPAAAETVAITGAKIVIANGLTIEDGLILIVDGKLTYVGEPTPAKGEPIKIPYDAQVIDAKGKVVFPGMVLAHTSEGLDRANESVPVGPYLDVFDSLDPSRLFFESSLREGVTTIHVIQGNDCVVGGLGRVVHPLGLTVDAMTSREASALKISVFGKRGFDRVRQRALLRETFAELGDYLETVAEARYAAVEKEASREVTVPPAKARELGAKLIRDEDLDDKHRNLYRLVQGRLDAYVYVDRAQDASFALELAREQGFLARTVFVLGPETYKAAALFAAAKRPVILSGELVHRETDRLTGEEQEVFVPKVFADAKVAFALLPGEGTSQSWLWYQAARCVAEGVSREVALAAITTVPAQACGLGERAGYLAAGFDADLLILSGDPLEITTQVERVLIGGKVVYERSKDWRLRKLISGTEQGEQKAADPKPADKAADKPADKAADKPADKPADKTPEAPKGEQQAPEKEGGK